MDKSGVKRDVCINNIMKFQRTLSQIEPRLDLLIDYELVTNEAWNEYAKVYQDKTSINFDKFQNYIDTVDNVIYKFKLNPI